MKPEYLYILAAAAVLILAVVLLIIYRKRNYYPYAAKHILTKREYRF